MSCAVASSSRTLPLPLPLSTLARRPASRTRLHPPLRRPLSTASPDIGSQLRAVMRDVPQPVSIAVARLPSPHRDPASGPPDPKATVAGMYRGTTLSSLTSLTLHPHPLVAFSLRLPSRMADCLRRSGHEAARRRVTVSLLSSAGESVAEALSRPYTDQAGIFARRGEWDDGEPPGLRGSVGVLRCEVVSSLPLADLLPPASRGTGEVEPDGSQGGSELFICRVLEVEHGDGTGQPLVHHQRKYKSMPQDPPDDPDAHD